MVKAKDAIIGGAAAIASAVGGVIGYRGDLVKKFEKQREQSYQAARENRIPVGDMQLRRQQLYEEHGVDFPTSKMPAVRAAQELDMIRRTVAAEKHLLNEARKGQLEIKDKEALKQKNIAKRRKVQADMQKFLKRQNATIVKMSRTVGARKRRAKWKPYSPSNRTKFEVPQPRYVTYRR